MDITSMKAGMETTKEINHALDEKEVFDPDKRMGKFQETENKHDEGLKDAFDPDKRLEQTEYYSSEKERIDKTPAEDSDFGTWEGERGNSKFIPSDDTEKGRLAKAKLAEKGLDGIIFKNGEPDFSKSAEETIQIDNMTENRLDYRDENGIKMDGNFTQADKQCAEKWTKEGKMKEDGTSNWEETDVVAWRNKNNCTWHECCDRKTMHLISRDIHDPGKFTHLGGCAECKIRDNKNQGGIFDE